jgi:hypothetical protein
MLIDTHFDVEWIWYWFEAERLAWEFRRLLRVRVRRVFAGNQNEHAIVRKVSAAKLGRAVSYFFLQHSADFNRVPPVQVEDLPRDFIR